MTSTRLEGVVGWRGQRVAFSYRGADIAVFGNGADPSQCTKTRCVFRHLARHAVCHFFSGRTKVDLRHRYCGAAFGAVYLQSAQILVH